MCAFGTEVKMEMMQLVLLLQRLMEEQGVESRLSVDWETYSTPAYNSTSQPVVGKGILKLTEKAHMLS